MHEFMTIILLCSIRLIALLLLLSVIFKLFERKLSASIRYTIWRVFAIIALIPINYHSPLINVNHSIEQSTVSHSGELQELATNSNYNDSIDFWKIMFIFWIAGTLSFLMYQIMKNAAIISRIRRWFYFDEEAENIFKQVKSELKIGNNVKLYRSKAAVSPLEYGFIHQTVVIPSGNYNNDELRLIFKHELTHVSRLDSVYKWIMLVLVAIYWFNPFIYLFLYRFNAECELSCDEKVTKNCCHEECFSYGELILKSASQQKNYLQLYPSMAIRNSSLKNRLQQIIDGDKNNPDPIIGNVVLFVSLTFFLLMPFVIGYGNIPVEPKTHLSASAVQIKIQDGTSTMLSENVGSFETKSTTENTNYDYEKIPTDTTTSIKNHNTLVNASDSLNNSNITTPTTATVYTTTTATMYTTTTATMYITTTATVYRQH